LQTLVNWQVQTEAEPQLHVSTFWQIMRPMVEMVVSEFETDDTRLLAIGLVQTR